MSFVKSQQLFEKAKKLSPGGVHSPVRAFKNVDTSPRFMTCGDGPFIEDVDGNRYVDYCLSWGPLLLGHADEDVKDAVTEAIGRGWSFGTAEPYSLTLAEIITAEIPWVERIRFVNSGTEAVMSAIRVARAATKRDKILKFDGCYHGHADGMLVRAGSGLAEMASPDSAGVPNGTANDTLVAPLDDLTAVETIFAAHGSQIAAIIVEPIPANNGLLLQRAGYLDSVSRIAKKHGALVIFDEVITGFRIAFGGMAELTEVKPDLVTYGKVIGGGFPVGAFGGRAELMNLVAPQGPVYQAGTLSANPIAMTAGIATLRKIKTLNPYKKLEADTESLAQALETVARESSDIPCRIQRASSLFWLVLGHQSVNTDVVRTPLQIPAQQKEYFAKLYPLILEQGYYLAPSGYEVGFLSTAHQQEHLDGLVKAFGIALSKLKTLLL